MFIIAAAPPSSAPIITAPVARAASPTVTTGLVVDVGRPVPLGPGPVWLPRLVLLDSDGLPVLIGVGVVNGGWVWV